MAIRRLIAKTATKSKAKAKATTGITVRVMSEKDKNALVEAKKPEQKNSDPDVHPGCVWAVIIFLVLFGLLWLVGANAFALLTFFVKLIWFLG